jgi:hypothetical protein
MRTNIMIRVTESDKSAITHLANISQRSVSSVVQLMIQYCLGDKGIHKLLGGTHEA